MLTDEELTARLGAAFDETAPELTYGGRVPHVRRTGGLAATSVLAAATVLALAPAALEREQGTPPPAVPTTSPSPQAGPRVTRIVDLGGLRFAYAQVGGLPHLLYFVGGSDLQVPPDAEKADIGAAGGAEVWFAHDPKEGDPQVYVQPKGSSMVYGMYGPGWTRGELTSLLQHPVQDEQGGS